MWQAKTAAYRAAAARGAVGGSMHVEHRHCAGSTAVGVEKACWLQASGPDISCLADTSSSPLHGSPLVARHMLLTRCLVRAICATQCARELSTELLCSTIFGSSSLRRTSATMTYMYLTRLD